MKGNIHLEAWAAKENQTLAGTYGGTVEAEPKFGIPKQLLIFSDAGRCSKVWASPQLMADMKALKVRKKDVVCLHARGWRVSEAGLNYQHIDVTKASGDVKRALKGKYKGSFNKRIRNR